MNFPNPEELSRIVKVTADLTATWNGVEYDLSKPTELQYGIVHHWKNVYPEVTFSIEAVTPTIKPDQPIVNPLEEADRGEAFAGLRKRKPKEE